jgi:hypothetical protein
MNRFYFVLWVRWAIRLTLSSVLFAAVLSFFITVSIYFYQGMPVLSNEVSEALLDIFKFWFPITWSVTLLLALFRSLKYIFNRCINGFELKLLTCKSALDEKSDDVFIETIGYGDLVKVWRKWFMLNIWMVGSFMILAIVYTSIFTSLNSLSDWFNIYWLFGFILLSGYFSFILLGARCKKVKVIKC